MKKSESKTNISRSRIHPNWILMLEVTAEDDDSISETRQTFWLSSEYDYFRFWSVIVNWRSQQ